jgi:hypothetical protein
MLVMSNSSAINATLIQTWISGNQTLPNIEEQLIAEGYDDDTVKTYLKEFNKVKRSKKQFTGFILMGVGAFLGFVSCLLTILNPFPEFYNIILYGLTMFAITIILVGLYFVFE